MLSRSIPIALLKLYQRTVSPYLGPCCRFEPSCSEYMIRSISMNGFLLGLVDGMARLLKCHPFHSGGYDPPRRIHLWGSREEWKNV